MTTTETRAERLADACVHIVGVSFGLVASASLITAAAITLPTGATVSLVVYGVALVLMLAFSAAYNMNRLPALSGLLRRFDHAAIFLKIAGTYTPFTLVKLGGAVGYGLFGVVWTVAIAGAVAKLARRTRSNGLYIVLYLALGWAGVFVIGPVISALPLDSLILLAAGAFFYTAGVVFHLWESLPFQNAIWHLFVLAGTACHFAAIVTALLFD